MRMVSTTQRQRRPTKIGRRYQGSRATGMTHAGKRLFGALKEVLADVRGEKPLAVVAVFPDKIDRKYGG
jgi:hypothetical protein